MRLSALRGAHCVVDRAHLCEQLIELLEADLARAVAGRVLHIRMGFDEERIDAGPGSGARQRSDAPVAVG